MKKTFKQVEVDGNTYNFLDLPGTNLFKFEVVCSKGAHIERVLNNEFDRNFFGISHLIEHIKFKRTKDFTTDELWDTLLNEGQFNASTGHSRISYWFKTVSQKKETAIQVVCNIAFNDFSLVPEDEFLSEKKTVCNEANDALNKIDQMFYRNARCVIAGHDLEDNVIGLSDTIKNFTLADIKLVNSYFLNKENHSFNIIFDSTRGETYEDIILLIQKQLSRFKFNTPDISINDKYLSNLGDFNLGNYVVDSDSKQKKHYILLDVVDNSYTSDYTTRYLNDLSGDSSLFKMIREDAGLSYSPHLYEMIFSNKYYVVFSCDVTFGTEEEMLSLFEKSINDTCDNFTQDSYKKLINSLQLDRTISLTNQNLYADLFSFAYWDKNVFDKYSELLSMDIDEAYLKMDNDLGSFNAIKVQLESMKLAVNNKKYALVTNEKKTRSY